MQLIDLFCAAVSIRSFEGFFCKLNGASGISLVPGGDKAKSRTGQLQCRRNATMVGLPFELGSCSFEVVGALDPTEGTGFKLSTFSGDNQEWSSCGKVIVSVSIEKRVPIIV